MASTRWWKTPVKKSAEPHVDIFRVLDNLDNDNERRNLDYKNWLNLYTNRVYDEFKPGRSTYRLSVFDDEIGVKLNVIQSCIDTLSSKIASSRPTPQFLTDNGKWEEKSRAKKLEKFVGGTFYDARIYDEARLVFVDAAIFGTGFMKIYSADGKVKVERVFPGEMVVDEQSCMTSSPRTMYQCKYVPLDVIQHQFPKYADQLALAEGERMVEGQDSYETDLVKVVEAWHIPSGKNAGDGRHVICIKECTLLYEEYKRKRHPFVVLRWTRQPFGWFGQGLAEQLSGIQKEIDKLIRRIQDAMHLFSNAKMLMEKGAVKKENLRNVTGDIIETEPGHPMPTIYMPTAVSNEVFNHLWQLYAKAYEISGISQMSASSVKPTDVESGIALRTLVDVETQRFALLVRDWEDLFVEAAGHVVEVAKEENGGKPVKTKWVAKGFVETVEWKDVSMDDDDYVMKVYPSNLLPQTPFGKLSTIQDLIKIGLISEPKEAMGLLDYPDLQRHQSLESADIDDVDMIIGSILDSGKYVEPMPWQNLGLALKRMNSALLRARLDNAPDDRLTLMEQWLEQAAQIMEMQEVELAQKQQMMQQSGMQGPAMGPTGPAPEPTPEQATQQG